MIMQQHIIRLITKTDGVNEITSYTDKPSYSYLCEYIKNKDMKDSFMKKFCIIRKYEIINDVAYDTDFLFIEKDLLENLSVWPAIKYTDLSFSDNVSFYLDEDFLSQDEVYDIYTKKDDDNLVIEPIPCNKIRLYHPGNKKKCDYIIYADSNIGSIHMHFLCRLGNSQASNAKNVITNMHENYSEYQDFSIPDIEWLFNSGKAFFKENTGEIDVNDEDVKDALIIDNGDTVYADFRLLTLPFMTLDNPNEGIVVKTFDATAFDAVQQTKVMIPLRVIVFPYDNSVNEVTHLYNESSKLSKGTAIFQNDASIKLAAEFGFDNGEPAIITKFIWDNKSITSIRDAYEYYYGVDLNYYVQTTEIDEDDEEESGKECAFNLKIYSDKRLQNEIYSSYIEIDNLSENIDNFSFWLSGIFSDWRQFTDIIIIQTSMTDKFLGHVLKSEPIMITLDKLRYLINEETKGRTLFEYDQQDIKTKSDMDLSKINFIDKVTCIVNKKANQQNLGNIQNSTPKVLYKPIFYRVQPVDNIELHIDFEQNVGIKLADYMAKTESFCLKIGDKVYGELGRNDAYVIFKVNTLGMTNSGGRYYITNQDNELITYGNYTLI